MGKKILMICYYYPPLTDVGCKRSVAFSKYWKKAGWEPYVLSVKNPDKAYCSLGEESPPQGIDVTYTHSLFNVYKFFGQLNGLLSRILKIIGIKLERNYFHDLLCIPDVFIGWIPMTIIRGHQMIKKYDIDVIYVSCSPFSAGIAGWCLKKITKLPLVIDYRDPFGLDISRYNNPFTPVGVRKPINRWIDGKILKAADLFTVTSEELKELYIEQFPCVKEKIHTIYNGFDNQFLEGIEEVEKFNKFTIIYSGNFYYGIEYEYFFEGLGILKKERKIDKENFQFLFYGGNLGSIQETMQKHCVEDLVDVRERIDFQDILREIKRSHLQLLRIAQPMISTKLFEGIALNIPFLATIPNGEVVELIKRYNSRSFIVTEKDSKLIAQSITDAMLLFLKREDKSYESDDSNVRIDDFSREKIALSFLDLMSDTF